MVEAFQSMTEQTKSLFAQASAKKFVGENVLGARNAGQAPSMAANKASQP